MNPLSNARHPGEKFAAYRARRLAVNKAIKLHLKGRLVHESSRALILPPPGKDYQVEDAILRQQIRDVTTVVGKDGELFRVGRTKGVIYRKPKKGPL